MYIHMQNYNETPPLQDQMHVYAKQHSTVYELKSSLTYGR